MHELLAATLRARQNQTPAIPPWADSARLAALLGRDQPERKCWLVQDAASASTVLQAKPPVPAKLQWAGYSRFGAVQGGKSRGSKSRGGSGMARAFGLGNRRLRRS